MPCVVSFRLLLLCVCVVAVQAHVLRRHGMPELSQMRFCSLSPHLAELGEEHSDGEVDGEVGAEEHNQHEVDPRELRHVVL